MVQNTEYTQFLQLHEAQLLTSGVPQWFWKSLHTKLKNQEFNTNDTFALLQIDYGDELRAPEDPVYALQINCEDGVKCQDEKHIYLIDHAWTFRVNKAKEQLLNMPNLLDRMSDIMGIEDNDDQDTAEKVYQKMWKYCQTYSIGNAENVEDRLPVWYIMDELGCAVKHSAEPNFRTVPFVYVLDQLTYTLLFPIKDVKYGELVSRDFAENITDPDEKRAHLIPWIKHDFTDLDFSQTEPDINYFLSGHIRETLPENINFQVTLPTNRKIKVYSEYSVLREFLTDDRFELTDDEHSADILWYTKHFKTYAELSQTPNRFVNQFAYENVITIKDLLSIVCQRNVVHELDEKSLDILPNWYPVTYNLKTELPKFISYYQNRQKQKLDNHWICKPWNLARGLDTYITDNLDFIVRLPESGPKIAQKYIHNPVLFNRSECGGNVKFDVRYVILLKSVAPLHAYIYNNFFLRFANKPFELKHFDEYEKHFTVMNYTDEAQLHHLPCAEFLMQWTEQYSEFPWREIEQRILKMLRELFEAAISLPPPRGIAPNPQSRAVYAADIILSWDQSDSSPLPYIQPKLLEINWTPDCKRACDYYPDFYNDIFACLFLNEEVPKSFTAL